MINTEKIAIFSSLERMKVAECERNEMAKKIELISKEPMFLHDAYEKLDNAFYECILAEAKYLTEL